VPLIEIPPQRHGQKQAPLGEMQRKAEKYRNCLFETEISITGFLHMPYLDLHIFDAVRMVYELHKTPCHGVSVVKGITNV
jgi:hypothetical protein